MATVSISFVGQADKNPYNTSDNPAGADFTSRGAATAQVFSNAWYGNNSSANTLWSCDVDPVVNTFSLQTVFDTVDSNSRGVAVFNSSGNGFMFIARNTDVRVFALATWALSGSALATYATEFGTGGILNVDVTQSTGTYTVKNDSTTIGTFVNTTYTSGLKGGLVARGAGRTRSFTLTYTPAQLVNSINSGNDITEGQAAVAADLSGFTSRPTSITTNQTGITCSNIGGTTNAPTFDLSGWTEGQPYPVLPVSVQFTFTYSTESAAGSETVTYDPAYTKVVFSSPIIDNSALPTYWIEQDGHTANGGAFYYDAYSDLVVSTDGDFTVTDSGQFTAWFRPASGATSGNMYEYIFTVVDGSIVSAESGLTSRGLTNTGLVSRGLVSRGL